QSLAPYLGLEPSGYSSQFHCPFDSRKPQADEAQAPRSYVMIRIPYEHGRLDEGVTIYGHIDSYPRDLHKTYDSIGHPERCVMFLEYYTGAGWTENFQWRGDYSLLDGWVGPP